MMLNDLNSAGELHITEEGFWQNARTGSFMKFYVSKLRTETHLCGREHCGNACVNTQITATRITASSFRWLLPNSWTGLKKEFHPHTKINLQSRSLPQILPQRSSLTMDSVRGAWFCGRWQSPFATALIPAPSPYSASFFCQVHLCAVGGATQASAVAVPVCLQVPHTDWMQWGEEKIGCGEFEPVITMILIMAMCPPTTVTQRLSLK